MSKESLPWGMQNIKAGAMKTITDDKLATFVIGAQKKTKFQRVCASVYLFVALVSVLLTLCVTATRYRRKRKKSKRKKKKQKWKLPSCMLLL